MRDDGIVRPRSDGRILQEKPDDRLNAAFHPRRALRRSLFDVAENLFEIGERRKRVT
jgi:hypothetical protein